MRTLVDIPEPQIRSLDVLARRRRRSRAALIREAVESYLGREKSDALDASFGAWKDRDDIGDGVEYQRKLRAEWPD